MINSKNDKFYLFPTGKTTNNQNAWLYGVMALQSKNVVIMEVNGAKTATNSKWGRKNVNLILLKN